MKRLKMMGISLMGLLLAGNVSALNIKIGVLAPEGTSWAKNLKLMAKEIKNATNKEVKLKIYFGGSQGDEPDVLRKIRVGQLQGGVFTGRTLGDIYKDVRVMELPFTFYQDRGKALRTLKSMEPFFNSGFEEANFIGLGFVEIGNVYFVSKEKASSLDNLKGMKIWSWEGDELVAAMIKVMDLVSVPLAIPDVLSSLSTGIIEAAYAPPLGIIALQWNTKIKFLIDFPLSYSVGALLVNKKTWSKISKEHQVEINKITSKYLDKINEANVQDNIDALNVMKSLGIEFVTFSEKDLASAKDVREKVVTKLRGHLFSEKALKLLEAEISKM